MDVVVVKPDMAMAGGSNQAKLQELLDAVVGNCNNRRGWMFVQPLFQKKADPTRKD